MKRIVETNEESGLSALLGERITLMCLNYIYSGTLIGVNETCVELRDAAIVYETGAFDEKDWTEAQRLQPGRDGATWFVQTAAVESFGMLK